MIPIQEVPTEEKKPPSDLIPVVGIKFHDHGKIYYFDPNNKEVEMYAHAIVETKHGLELGKVVHKKDIEKDNIEAPLKPIVRVATDKDIKQKAHFVAKEEEAFDFCKEKISELGLNMKLIKAEYTFNGSLIRFLFTSESRVDFRELVKMLTRYFRQKVELRQIGPREHTKLNGGIGKCGRTLCCYAWMNKFNSITLQMAATQLMSTKNIDKITGLCGRLLCCLQHEHDFYQEQSKKFPALQSEIKTKKGKGKVIDVNILKEKLRVILEDRTIIEVEHRVS